MSDDFLHRLDLAFKHAGNPSRREIARKAKLSESYFADLYDHSVRNPRSDTLKRVADALGVEFNWLATGAGELDGNQALTDYHTLPSRERAVVDDLIKSLKSRATEGKSEDTA